MDFRIRPGELCLIIGVSGALVMLAIFEVSVDDGARLWPGNSMKSVATGIERSDRTLVLRGPDDNVVAIEFGGDFPKVGAIEVGRTLDMESAEFRGRMWIWRSVRPRAVYAVDK